MKDRIIGVQNKWLFMEYFQIGEDFYDNIDLNEIKIKDIKKPMFSHRLFYITDNIVGDITTIKVTQVWY